MGKLEKCLKILEIALKLNPNKKEVGNMKSFHDHIFSFCSMLAFLAVSVFAQESVEKTILDTKSFWRCYSVRGSELIRMESGELQPLYEFGSARLTSRMVDGKRKYAPALNKCDRLIHTPPPPSGWEQPDFDDSTWARARGPLYVSVKETRGKHVRFRGSYRSVIMLCVRGKFFVKDPATAKDLAINLKYQGGTVVYMNGKEIHRSHLPQGTLKFDTPAEEYPKEAYLKSDGYLLTNRGTDPKEHTSQFDIRTRSIAGFKIPAAKLKKGVNVLAIEVHRSPAPAIMFSGRTKKLHNPSHLRGRCWWGRIGVADIQLTAKAGSSVVANTDRLAGVRVWNYPVIERLYFAQYPDPNEPLKPVRIIGVKNGAFSGQVVVSQAGPITGLKASASDLKGPSVISASHLQIRYSLLDGFDGKRRKQSIWFDGLEEFAPEQIEVTGETKTAMQPIWLTVNVPVDAAPGNYKGILTINAEGMKPTEVPVELRVVDWHLPDRKEYKTHIDLMQSPETLAMKYNVPMWSDKHWKLIEKSFKLLSQVGNKAIYVTLVRRTHFGNEHGMVRWTENDQKKLTPDLSIAEKYIELGVKHLGKVPMVGLYCWEPIHAPAHFPAGAESFAPGDRPILFSKLNPADGTLEKAKGPKWGTPECVEFWKPAIGGLRKILAKHGIEKSAMLGIACDYMPTKPCMNDLTSAAPGLPWIMHSHVYRTQLHGIPIAYLASVWGLNGARDPAGKPDYYKNTRYYGWRNPFMLVAFPRYGCPVYYLGKQHRPGKFRFGAEGALVSVGKANAKPPGIRGFGRLGADFWPVIKAKISGRSIAKGHAAPLCGRYPESTAGGMSLTYVSYYILSPGRDGAISSTRFEMVREGLQEAEARVFIESVLLDEMKKTQIPSELAGKCQQILDERVRTFMRGTGRRELMASDWLWYNGMGWQKRSEELYSAAGELAEALKASQ